MKIQEKFLEEDDYWFDELLKENASSIEEMLNGRTQEEIDAEAEDYLNYCEWMKYNKWDGEDPEQFKEMWGYYPETIKNVAV